MIISSEMASHIVNLPNATPDRAVEIPGFRDEAIIHLGKES